MSFKGLNVNARMYDIEVTGYNNKTNKLHLFDIDSVDETIVEDGIAFDKEDIEKNLTLFLYPDDSDENGRLLRIYQQYFMVSAGAQLILDECIAKGCNLHDLADYAVIQINDTHPTMVIPELIRLLVENDDLRNRNGLMRRNEQEQLEKEIKDVRDRNSKLVMQVNQSSVEAVEQAKKKQEEAEKQARQAEYQIEREKNRADMEIQRARRKAKSEIADMKENQFFWDWGYLCVIFFSFLQNGAFQQDVLQLIMIPINWCKEYIAWFERLEYISDTAGEMLFKGFFSMLMITAGILGCVFLVWAGVEQYKKIWDDLYKMVLISSISFVAVLGNLIREYLPLNLILVILFINIGTILLRAYLKKKYPQMYD